MLSKLHGELNVIVGTKCEGVITIKIIIFRVVRYVVSFFSMKLENKYLWKIIREQNNKLEKLGIHFSCEWKEIVKMNS